MRKSFSARNGGLYALFLFLSLFINANMLSAQCASGTLSGVVYVDANNNGINESNENFQSGLLVRAFNASGTWVAQASSDSNGKFEITGLTDGEAYRLEYSLGNNFQVSNFGTDNGGDIQFATAPYCQASLGLSSKHGTCGESTEVFLSCFVNGLGTNSPRQETLIGLVNSFNASSQVNVYATQAETGAVWGMTYDESTQQLYSSAFVKQHASLGPGGIDAIYKTSVSGTPSTAIFTKLSALGQNVGALTVSNSSNCAYGIQAGKVGLGGLTSDDTGSFLYVANLFNNTIVKINASNPTTASTTAYQVPNPGCSLNDDRIFGLKYHNGAIYVGVTCTGENTGDENDTSIHVYEMNTTSGAFSLVFSNSYSYGYWSDTNISNKKTMQWLTDIDFDSNNNMVLALSDRIGHSYCNGGSSRIDDQFGDVLMATPSNGTWVLENNGTAGSNTGTGVGNTQGPGGGEFFGDDFFPANPSNHPEVSLGSIYILPGSDEVIVSVFDPAFSAYSGGLHRYSTQTGQKVGVRELYNQNISDYFGKATGFGDLTAACGPTSLQIGNYVWIDSNCNGIQDAGEPAKTNTEVALYDDQCNLVSTTTTDENGNYSFNSGINAGAQYYVALAPNNYDATTGSYSFSNVLYAPTLATLGTSTGSDLDYSQSCSSLNGMPVISVLPTANNNVTFDIGIKPATDFDLALMLINLTPNNNEYTDIIDFEIQVYNQGSVAATNYEIVDYVTSAYQFDASLNPGWVYNNGMAKLMINNILLPGQNHNETIRLKLVGSETPDDLINKAEISYTMDTNGNQDSDFDSTSDDISTNDVGGLVATATDDLITDSGLIDEDDEDPAMVYIFDLALSKANRNNRAYDAGENVTFDITVTNQGNVDATSFDVADNYPIGLIFNPGNNPGWNQVGPQLVKYTHNQNLQAGASTILSINFTVGDTNKQLELMNYAEISDFVAATPSIVDDFDSVPDTDMFNDVGGVPYSATDGMILDHAIVDEDDHDPAGVSVRAIDLALIKKVSQTSYELGSRVVFEIQIHNQGTASIGKLQIVDFLPNDMTLVDNAWTLDNSGQMAYKDVVFLSPLQPGQVHTDFIELQINANGATGAYLNYAEISEVYDVDNNNISNKDIDSSADAIMGNDPGGMPATAMDDYLDGTGLDDEDDSDPAMIYVPTIQFSEECACLNNATQGHDGQFSHEIEITSTSGEDWYIDFEYEFYTIFSAPGTPTSYATGPTGYKFTEIANGDGTSSYVLKGKSIDGNPFSLRATNGWGVYLSIEGGDCDYCAPLVEGNGLGAVCASSTHTYTVDTSDPKYDDCDGFVWYLSGGAGVIVDVPGTNVTGSGTGFTGNGTGPSNEITIEWGAVTGAYDLILFPDCPNDCVAPVSLSVQVGMDDEAMSCLHELNVSLNDGCESTLYAEDILTSEMSSNVAYQLILTDAYGGVIQGNNINADHLWTRLMAKVMNPCSGNSCWAFINVEDKLPPKIQCDDIEVKCYQMHNYEPLVIDNCSTAEYIQTGETTTPLPCTSPYIKEIYRTYVAEDGYGNVSQPCTQKINVLPIDLDDIEIPIDYSIANDNALSCQGLELNDEGNPAVSITGVPTIGGVAIYPVNDFYCNIGVDFRDVIIVDFGCSKKLMRTWTVYDGCREPLRRVQTIEIADIRAPWVTCPSNITINTDGSVGCDSEYTIPMPEITDDCTVDNFVIDVTYAGGLIKNYNSPQTIVLNSADNNLITYNVYDQCGNATICEYNVTVMDNVSPTAICDQNSVVSLRMNGTAKAFPQTFDDGSYDDCDLFKTLVRRMDSPCDCDRPRYDDMKFLGERNGRFYYLSSFERPCFKAFSYAAAYGGSLLTLESAGEHDWVYEKVNEYLPGVEYYIGLKDKNGSGEFTWDNHATPSFNQWAGGGPSDDGDCVVVNAAGEWQDVNDLDARFVLEVSNPCGFSSEVSFCCADVGQESMVVLRAIDYFGGYNDCMVNIEVQDKVPPTLACPDNVVLDCATPINIINLDEYGSATASDSCVVNITSQVIDERNQCGLGRVIRRFTASDNSGSSECDQIISFNNDNPFDFDAIVKPLDFDTSLGCNFGALHPDNLPSENAYPIYPADACDLVDGTFEDQVFSFAGPGSDACLKILRKWTVIDWCQNDANGQPMTVSFDQTIKVINVDGPIIDEGSCDDLTINTQECDNGDVVFTVTAHDDCTPDAQLQNCLRIDIDSDGTFDIEDCLVSNVVSFNNKLPLGHHTALISFSDLCGNTVTCSKEIWVENNKAPIAYCKSGLSVALEPMDLVGNDGIPDDEMACIFPHMLDVNSSHPCGSDISLSFCNNDPTDMICFDCTDIGTQIVTLCVIDEFGNSASCQTTVEVQDNNDGDFCPEFDLALIKQIDFSTNTGPFSPGDDVDFRIIVLNQGNQDAYNINVADYIPTGFTLNDTDWNMTAGTAYLNAPIAFIPAGGSASVFITLSIDNNYMGECLINYAEIIGADDDNDPSTPGREDLDSTPDTDQTNDIVGGDNILDNSNNDEDDHDLTKVDVVQVYDLALTKSVSNTTPGPYMPGDVISYDITVSNQGTLDATTVYVSDNVPTGLILNDPNWTLSGSEAVLSSPITFLGAGSSSTVTITFTIDPMFMGSSILNDAQIIDPDNSDRADIDSDTATDKDVDEDGDGDGDDDDEDWAMIAVGQVFDLALTKVVSSAGPYLLGDVVRFEITVFNQGSLDATNVQITDYVPAGLTFSNSAFNNSQGWSSGPSPSLTIGTVGVGAVSTAEIELTIDASFAGTTLVNNAEITAAENALNLPDEDSTPNDNSNTPSELGSDNDVNDAPDNPNDNDDYDPAEITVDRYDLALTKNISTTTPGPYMQGSTVTYDIVVTNEGSLDATTVQVADNIPSGLNLTDSNWNISGGQAVLNTPIGFLASGNSVTVSITFEIDMAFMGTSILNDAQIIDPDGSDIFDIDSNTATDKDVDEDGDGDGDDDDEDWAMITIGQNFDLALTKVIVAGGPATYQPGDIVTFSIAVTNQGSLDATNVQITDYVPSDLIYTQNAFNNAVGWGSGPNPVLTIGNVPFGNTVTRSIQLQIDPNYTGALIVNDAEITNAENALGLADEDSTPGDNANTPSETGTDNDIDDAPDNPNDNDDYDPAEVQVDCNLLPVCSVLPSFTVELDANGQASITGAQLDNGSFARCDGLNVSLALSQTTFTCADKTASNIVTVTVTDDQGNVSNDPNCQTTIQVLDVIDPTITCQGITTTLDANGDAIINLADVIVSSDDNCSIVSTVLTPPAMLDICDSNTATITVTDICNNTATCSFEVSLVDQAPVARCKDPFDLCLDANGMATLTAADIDNGSTDDCGIAQLAISQMAFDCNDVGPKVIMLSVFDNNAMPQTDQCTTVVTIIDKTPPIAICQSITVEVNAAGTVSIAAVQIDNGSNDACGLAVNPFVLSQNTFDCTNKGITNTVTLTVTDANGNTASCSANVNLQDNIDPSIACRTSRFVDLDADGQFTIASSFIVTGSSDNCPGHSVALDRTTFTCVDKANVVVVTATATDVSGNTATCSTNITVRDRIAPTCTLLANQVFNVIGSPPTVVVDIDDILDSYSDNCALAPTTSSISPNDFTCMDLGLNTVTLTVDDGCGNTSTCFTQITVQDVSVPTCNVIPDITLDLESNGMLTIVPADINISSTAGCDPNATLVVAPNFFACNSIPLNPHCVILTVTSSNGNSATCKSNVTVQDVTPPTVTCRNNFTLDLDINGNASLLPADIITSANDECDPITQVIDISSFNCDDKPGPIVVTATVTDDNGNSSTCTTNVTIDDDFAPSCTLSAGLSFNLIGTPPSVTLTVDDVLDDYTDNCGTTPASATIAPATFDCADVGPQVVTVTVTDACGNTGTCTTSVNIADTSNPTCIAQDVTVCLDDTGNGSVTAAQVDNGSNAGCGTNVNLSVTPTDFDCTDLGANTVILTVTTTGGNSSTCTATVTVEDKIAPVITCPADETVECGNSMLSNLELFGDPTATDNCQSNIGAPVETLVSDIGNCGLGTFTRTFVMSDGANFDTCSQVITVAQVPEFTADDIVCPMAEVTLDGCIDLGNIYAGTIEIAMATIPCVNIVVDSTFQDISPQTMGTCVDTFLKTWTILEECTGNSFTCEQTIILSDGEGPSIMCNDVVAYLPENFSVCSIELDLPVMITDPCTMNPTATNNSPFATDMNSGNAGGTYPGGATDVVITAVDNCNNESTCEYTVTVLDTFATISNCKKIIESIQANMTGLVTIDQACVTIDSSCPDDNFFLSFSDTDNMVTSFLVDCDDAANTGGIVPGGYMVHLWSGDVLLHSCGNFLQVLDGAGHCTAPIAEDIVGRIYTEDDEMLPEVMVNLEGSNMGGYMTDDRGYYAFEDVNIGDSYMISPEKDKDYLNGVSTLDLIIIQRHVLGLEPLDSPYKIIAADINKSDEVNGLDLAELRKLILGLYNELPANTSWRMVDAGHQFIDPTNPFLAEIPEDYIIYDLQSEMEVDFIGVKVGDVNGSVLTSLQDKKLENRSGEKVQLRVPEVLHEKGSVQELVFSMKDFSQVDGFQYTIELDPEMVELIDFNPVLDNLSLANVNMERAANGIIHFSWNTLRSVERENQDLVLFELLVKHKDDLYTSEYLSISQSGLRPEAYVSDAILDVELDFVEDGIDDMFAVYQNSPNPWSMTTEIEYYLPSEEKVLFNVYSVDGELVLTSRKDGVKGSNIIILEKEDLSAGGVYYYEIITNDRSISQKMILIK